MGPTRNNNAHPRRVLVIGFDGATLDVIRPWAAEGLLPSFRRLMDSGAWGTLQSTMPPVTPAAWSTLATGMNQGKHGLYDFFARREGSYETLVVNSTHRHGSPFWRLLSQAGKRVCVFNVPATYPPDPVNGLMVSGLLTPTHAVDASYPVAVLEELKRAIPDFGFYPPGIFSKGKEPEFIQSVLDWDRMTLRAADFLMDRAPWDLCFLVFSGVDIMSHFMWQPAAIRAAAGDRQVVTDAVRSIYRQADDILGTLLERAGDDTYVMVVSDHGFGPLDHYIHLNAWLAERGYLKFKRTPGVALKYLAYRLGLTPLHILTLMRGLGLGARVQETAGTRNEWFKEMVKRAFLSLEDVDWSRTTAYSAGYGGPLFANLRGRQPQGIVEPGIEYEALLQRLADDLLALRHPLTDEPLTGAVYRRADLYSGPLVDQAPDLMFEPRDWRNQGYGVHDFASNRWLEPSPDRTGTHRMDGVFFLRGPGVPGGQRIEGASLQDIAPTILSLMDTPIPKDVDGHVLQSALSRELSTELRITYEESNGDGDRQDAMPVMTSDEEQVIKERLEALGYWG